MPSNNEGSVFRFMIICGFVGFLLASGTPGGMSGFEGAALGAGIAFTAAVLLTIVAVYVSKAEQPKIVVLRRRGAKPGDGIPIPPSNDTV